MSNGGFKILMRRPYNRITLLILYVSIIIPSVFTGYLSNSFTFDLTSNNEFSNSPQADLRLMSFSPLSRNEINRSQVHYSLSSLETQHNQEIGSTSDFSTSNNLHFDKASCKISRISGQDDVVIDSVSPEAMEINATSMDFKLNFTITGSEGNPKSAFQNLTISNTSHAFPPITDWDNWDIVVGTDKYSLTFTLNNSVLSQFSLGLYNLTLSTIVLGHFSNDSFRFPMKDLQINNIQISPSEFNNKLDSDQLFNITMWVREDYGTTGSSDVTSLLENPNVTLISVLKTDVSGPLHFIRFINHGYEVPLGQFIFEVNLTGDVARDPAFDDAFHTLVVSVTSTDGITDNGTIAFEAVGNVLLVKIDQISVGSNPPFDYNETTNDSQKHIVFRINVNDFIDVSFYLWDNSSNDFAKESRNVIYQDPNDPLNPRALKNTPTDANGNGSVSLSANVFTPKVDGYELFFYVSGHKSSQEEDPSNVSIFWDYLDFDYTFYDNQFSEDGFGSSNKDNEKARGVDIGEWWVLNLFVNYLTDQSPAYNTQINYSFGGGSWNDRKDGTAGDLLDGSFTINHTENIADTFLFECQVVNGSYIDHPNGILSFVDKTTGAAYFNKSITWTYLIIDMIPVETDRRLGTGEITEIDLSAVWAHDLSSFSGTLIAIDNATKIQKTVLMTNGYGTWPGLIKTTFGVYNFYVSTVIDDLFGITKFTNPFVLQPDKQDVQINIIWDDVYFTFSGTYNLSKSIIEQNWNVNSFFTNFGGNRTIYCYGRHSYDGKPFNGTAVLIDRDIGVEHPIIFNYNGVGNTTVNRTDARRWVPFKILFITVEPTYHVTRLRQTPANNITIVWDKILITLEANQTYSHGSWADISVSLEYEVSTNLIIDPVDIEYSLLMSNETFYEDISWIHFIDYSFTPATHWYNITKLVDYKTSLTQYDVLFNWSDIGISDYGNLTIFWIDDKDPTIVNFQSRDLGNGSILIIVDVTDDAENWEGSGIGEVKLFDNRVGVEEEFPLKGTSYLFREAYGIYRYLFMYTYNQTIEEGGWGNYFQFEFGKPLEFTVDVVDQSATPDWTGQFSPSNHTVTSEILTITANYDPYDPQFIWRNGTIINISYATSDESGDSTNINDGDIIIATYVQDNKWSGLNDSSVQLNITNIATSESSQHYMTLINEVGDGRLPLEFRWIGNLPVGEVYRFTVTVTDKAGNFNTFSREVEIKDVVAPRIRGIKLTPTQDRKVKIAVNLTEGGLGVDYVIVGLVAQDNTTQWFNLTAAGGIGAQQAATPRLETYSATLTLGFNLIDMINPKRYSIKINVSDKMGNQKSYGVNELENIPGDIIEIHIHLDPLIFHPIVLIFGLVLLITGIVIGIRISSKTVGYDMQKIFAASERISREEILTQMDEFALGVTVNFFDQVQGPVPVIWEPPLLEDQEQVMLDLSDKSFSTLEFVGVEETERSGTFDFSTGSYECTALGYSFAIPNPEARGGKENLTVVLLLRKEWGDNLLVFQDELLEKLREIRGLVESEQPSTQIEAKARNLREFVSKLMIAFDKIYLGVEKKSDSMVE